MSAAEEPRFLTLGQVMELHRRSLEEHGGLAGVRDAGAAESAMASAQNVWLYGGGDIHAIAAAYAFHLAEAQAFLDGNKRVAAACAVTFIVINGCDDRGDDVALHEAMIAIAGRRMDKARLAALLRKQFPLV